MTGREVRLLVVDDAGEPLGRSGILSVETMWWPDAEPVVQGFAAQGLDVQVLRVLPALSRPAPGTDCAGGEVTYLAQAGRGAGPPLEPVADGVVAEALAEHPLRAPWARVGGPATILAWADDVLAARGTPRTGPAEQVKTWNLSAIWRLPTTAGPVWCKSVPPFFAHEGPMIALVAATHPDLVPPLLGRHDATGTVLLGDVPGADQWQAPPDRLATMVDTVVALQHELAPRVDELLALGCPDWRGPALVDALTRLTGRDDVRGTIATDVLDEVDRLVAGLPRRVAELAGCGLPDTLVHGDLHPGNWRFGPAGLRLLDWGDSGVGNPLLDQPAFVGRVPEADRAAVTHDWVARWSSRREDVDADRALHLVPPLAALRQALIYRTFLDGIEPDEHVYHRVDVPDWLTVAAGLA